MDTHELAWAAGFFDGEGYVGLRTRRGKSYDQIQVSITQVGRGVLDRFARIVGVGKVYGPYDVSRYNVKGQPRYQYTAIESGARRVLELIGPWLSDVKAKQAAEALTGSDAAHLAAVGRPQDRPTCKRGHPFDATNTLVYYQKGKRYKSRACRLCRAENHQTRRVRRFAVAMLSA